MKKLLMGCGVILLVLVLILGVVVWKIGSFARRTGQQMVEIMEEYTDLNERLPFSPPEDGLVVADRLDVWLSVRRDSMVQAKEFGESMENAGFGAVLSMPDKISEFAHEFIDRLETAALSPAEYEWITGQVVSAIDNGDSRANADMKDIVTAFDKLSSRNRSQSGQNDIRSLRKPITSEQAASLCTLLIERKEPILKQMEVFYIDAMLAGMSKGMAQQQRNSRTSGGGGRESLEMEGSPDENPVPLPASG